ncbi:MAG: AsmA 2 protein [Thermodesulfobacteriota bacterium]|nr:AsmA 2 protein [Thermodesulfobacteriota bacterium]
MAFRRLRSILFLTFLLFLLFFGSVLLLHSLIQKPSVQDYLLQRLSEAVGYEIHANRIQLIFWKGVGIQARDFEVRTPGDVKAIAASRIRITLSLPELVRGRIVPTGLALEEPQIELDVGDGRWFSSSGGDNAFFGESPLKALAGFPSVTLERAQIALRGTPFVSRALFVRLSRRSRDPATFDVILNGKVDYRGAEVPLSARGHIAWDAISGPSAHVEVKAHGIPLSHIQLPDLPVKKGTADMDVTASGSLNAGISAKGKIIINDLDFAIIDDGDTKSFSFARLLLPFDASYSESALKIPSFQVRGPGFTLDVISRLDLKDKSNPYLSLSVTSDVMPVETFRRIFPSSLLPRWVDARLFPIFSAGQVRVDRFSLDGKLNQIKDLDLPPSASALLLQLTCRDLTAFKDAGGIPVEGVSGRLEIKNGGIRVSGVKAHFRDSQIEEGSLNVSSLYDDAPSIRVAAAGSVDIIDLLQQKDLPLIPDEVRRHLEGFSSTTGKIDGNIEVGYERNWPYPKMLKGNLSFRDCTMAGSAALIFPVFLKEGELIVDGTEKRRFAVKGRWGRSAIDASGHIGGAWESGEARVLAEADVGELIGHFYPDLHSTIFFRGPVPCRLTLVKGEKDWRFSGSLDMKGISLETDSMTVEPFGVKGDLGFSGGLAPGEMFHISNLTCTLGESSFGLTGTYDLLKEGRFDLRASSKKIRLEDLGVRFKKGNLKGKGTLAFDASIQGSRSQPKMTVVTGEARGSDLSFLTADFPHPVEQCNLALTFQGKDLSIESIDMKLGENSVHIEGKLQGWDGMRGDITVRSDFMDLSDLISAGIIAYFKQTPKQFQNGVGPNQAPAPPAWREGAGRLMEKSDIHLDITASRGQWEGFHYGPLRVECALRSGDLYITRSSAAWEHGELRLRGHVKRGKSPEMLFSGYIDMTRQPLGELPPSLDFISSRAEGMLTLEALLFAKGGNRENLVSSLTGSVNVLLDQCVLKKSNVFIKILDFLSLQGMFEGRPPHLSKEGIYFESIGAQFDLHKGIAKTEDVTMRGPAFNAAAMGEANLSTARVNGEIGIQPLGTIDFLISKVPVAGYLLTGDKKSLYGEYFKIDGPLSDPDVRYMPLKSLGNGTVGFLTRLLLTPKRMYKSISDAARDFEGKGYPLPDEHLKTENDMGGGGGTEFRNSRIQELRD